MLAFAFGHALRLGRTGDRILHGLQIVAVAIVAQAVLTMQRSLAPDAPRLGIALAAAAMTLFVPLSGAMLFAILCGALLGALLPAHASPAVREGQYPAVTRRQGIIAAVLFATPLALLPLTRGTGSPALGVFSAFYRTGALVFGGGHVVLPLLEQAIVSRGWVDQHTFLNGNGAAKALPGPLFTFAAFLGATISTTIGTTIHPGAHPVMLAAIALVAIFLPGMLLMVAILPFWRGLRDKPRLQQALRGVNAAVVGILFAAFVRPVWPAAVHSVPDALLALAALIALMRFHLAPWIVVLASVTVAAVASALS